MAAEYGYNALSKALCEQDKHQRIQTLRNLIENDTDVNSCSSNGCSALMKATGKGYLESVRLLLEGGAKTNHSDGEGVTALILAASNGNEECVRLLLEAGAGANQSNSSGHSALMLAMIKGHVECGRLLLKAGADVNQSTEKRETALRKALWCGHIECVRLLLTAGANVNDADMDGDTALISCLTPCDHSNKTKTHLALLINAGADIDTLNNSNLQAIHYALTIWPEFKFPAEYLLSENCDLSRASYDQIQTSIDEMLICYCLEEPLKEEQRLDILLLLVACGLPRTFCQSFIVEQEMCVRMWMETVASEPNTLKSLCVFEIRRRLGLHIKQKVTNLNLPIVIQNMILLKNILSSECFI